MNGFDLQLDDDIDDLAVESFWAFVSGGSSFLSAFEWILMMQHLVELVHDAEAAFAPHEVENMYGSEAVTENGNSTLLMGGDEAEVNVCSRILKLPDSVDLDVSNVAEQAGRGGLLGLDIDPHISHAADIGNSNAMAATVSMLAAGGAGFETEFMNRAYSDVDSFLIAPTPAENGCGVLKDDAAAHVVITNAAFSAVQLESLDVSSAADDVDQSGCRHSWKKMNGAATANTYEEPLMSENQEAQPEDGLGQVNEDPSLRMTDNLGAEVGTGNSDEARATLPSSAVTPALHAWSIKKGALIEAKSLSSPFASSIVVNAEFRCDPAALCMLTQVIRFSVLAWNSR